MLLAQTLNQINLNASLFLKEIILTRSHQFDKQEANPVQRGIHEILYSYLLANDPYAYLQV